jgi:hypothetical protein
MHKLDSAEKNGWESPHRRTSSTNQIKPTRLSLEGVSICIIKYYLVNCVWIL